MGVGFEVWAGKVQGLAMKVECWRCSVFGSWLSWKREGEEDETARPITIGLIGAAS